MVGSQFAPAALATRPNEKFAADEIAVDLTTEARWFFDGQLPPDVLSWFTVGGVGLVEDRCDRYRLDGEGDVGVKRRSGATLELKLRRGPSELFTIGNDVGGQLETWQRWSPADHLVHLTKNSMWVDVVKRVGKRRFRFNGVEVPLSEENRAMTGVGCDAEITTVEVNGRAAWTFAFAAFGPVEGHRRSLQLASEGLVGERARPQQLRLDYDNSCGYPRWITKFLSMPEGILQ